jgi:DNA repair protein SbcD/Mre11
VKLLLVGDSHIRSSSPRSRSDDFVQTQKEKWGEVLEIYKDEGCDVLLQAGDLWDQPRPSFRALSDYITLFRSHSVEVLTVYGQHDLYMHSLATVARSATAVMESAGVAKVLGDTPTAVAIDDKQSVYVYGASFGENPPRLSGACVSDDRVFNVLVCHAMVGDKPLWPGHQPKSPEQLSAENPGFGLILVGDYHYDFIYRPRSTTFPVVVNAGCLVRLTSGVHDLELIPGVVVFDTETRECARVLLETARPAEEVFRPGVFEAASAKKNESLVEFIDKLRSTTSVGTGFRANLVEWYRQYDIDVAVRDIIAEALEKAEVEV